MLVTAIFVSFATLLFGVTGFAEEKRASQVNFSEWSGWGGNIYNNRLAINSPIKASNAASLKKVCNIPFHLGFSAAPTVSGDMIYFPTWGGRFLAVEYKTCQVHWDISVVDIITQFAPVTDEQRAVLQVTARTSPQVDGDVVYIATQVHALLVAVNRANGAVLGTIQINPHPFAILTQSPTVYNGRIFIGASSFEEVAADVVPGYTCCSFVGNMAALTFDHTSHKFHVNWNVSMLPIPPAGWSGAAIWGSQPAIDTARSQVFIGTGNVYSLPEVFQQCQDQTANVTAIAQGLVPSTCIPSNVLQEAVSTNKWKIMKSLPARIRIRPSDTGSLC